MARCTTWFKRPTAGPCLSNWQAGFSQQVPEIQMFWFFWRSSGLRSQTSFFLSHWIFLGHPTHWFIELERRGEGSRDLELWSAKAQPDGGPQQSQQRQDLVEEKTSTDGVPGQVMVSYWACRFGRRDGKWRFYPHFVDGKLAIVCNELQHIQKNHTKSLEDLDWWDRTNTKSPTNLQSPNNSTKNNIRCISRSQRTVSCERWGLLLHHLRFASSTGEACDLEKALSC